jgi:hypothetical protein
VAAAIVVVVACGLGACGGSGPAPGPGTGSEANTTMPSSTSSPPDRDGPATTSPGATPTPGAPPTSSGTPAPPSASAAPEIEDLPVPTPSGRPLRVTGTVAAGVESGCVLLNAGTTTYLLLGLRETLQPGTRVTVEGTVTKDVMTTCQQGTPLQVRTVTPS